MRFISPPVSKILLTIAVIATLTLLILSIPNAIGDLWWINGPDWYKCLRPAALAMLHGESPYDFAVYNPPWIYVLLIPIALLPAETSFSIITILAYLPYALIAHRLKIDKINLLIFLTNPALIYHVMNGNIDWMIPLGLILPPRWGLFFVLAKPQLGAGVALFWLVEAYRSGGIKQVVRTFIPVTIAFALSFAVYGFYFLNGTEVLDASWNKSLFPYTIPIGLFLLVYSIKKRDVIPSLASVIFLSPYFSPQSLSVPIFGAIKNRWFLIGAVVVAWLVWIFLM